MYKEICAIERAHHEDNEVDEFKRIAKQSLKTLLIAKLCERVSAPCKKYAVEIASLDAQQAELEYLGSIRDDDERTKTS
jgi:hypothetical protein